MKKKTRGINFLEILKTTFSFESLKNDVTTIEYLKSTKFSSSTIKKAHNSFFNIEQKNAELSANG